MTVHRPGKLKGLALRALDQAFLTLRGEEARERAREQMPAELADAFRYRTLLPASWYPLDWYAELLASYRGATDEGVELCRQVGRVAARDEMLGIYKKLVLSILSPQLMFSVTQRFYSAFFDTGRVEVLEARKGYALARYSGCIGWDENMWAEMLGACEAFLEISGAKHVRGHIARGGKLGDDGCELEGHWV